MKLINQKAISAGEYSPRFKPGTPFLIEGCMIVQCLKGTSAFRLNFQDYIISEGDFIFLFNDMVIELGERSEDFTLRYVCVPETNVFEIFVNITSTKFWDTLYMSPVQKFSDMYSKALNGWMQECLLVHNICRDSVSDTIIVKLVVSLFMVMEDIISRNAIANGMQSSMPPWKILGEFMVLLSRHYTTQHNVTFYADALNITPDYLAVIIKEGTGFGPKETIDGKLVLAMKALLESTSLPIKSIAEHLHYDDTSHICKVFRRHTGISLGEYRKQHK